ncbi:MAG TPA: prepilin-type N-terminal cleavage/methylation domain-containing protein [Prosthecobacter sp.]
MKTGAALNPNSSRARAFSLLEMLIVVALVGILAAVAIAFLGGNHRDTMLKVRDQRNAQEIASLSISAEVCGAKVVVPGDFPGTIQNLLEGRQAAGGQFAGRQFKMSALTPEEISGAIRYLTWQGDLPLYNKNGR